MTLGLGGVAFDQLPRQSEDQVAVDEAGDVIPAVADHLDRLDAQLRELLAQEIAAAVGVAELRRGHRGGEGSDRVATWSVWGSRRSHGCVRSASACQSAPSRAASITSWQCVARRWDGTPSTTTATDASRLTLKAAKGENAELVASDPVKFFKPPYMAHHGYVGVYVDIDDVDWEEIRELITDAYRLAAPKSLAKLVD